MTWRTFVELLLIGYLPGALCFRLPFADRDRRASLPAEERVFWALILSVATSCALVLGLAAFDLYTFRRLVVINAALCVALAVAARGNLRLGSTARAPGWPSLIPVLLVAIGLWLYFPPAEWIIGGRDPGVYTNEGIQIAQRGSLLVRDRVAAGIPVQMRDLFFPVWPDGNRRRFMGFFVLDTEDGTVVGQFPHLYPASLAIGYGIDGLTGVRRTTGVWGILGVLAVYLAGVQFLGRPAAAAAAGLLSLHVAQVWFARFPNSELPMQALLFAGLLGYTRMDRDGLRFFGPIAASLFGLLFFLRLDAALVLLFVVAAVTLNTAVGRRTPAGFIVTLAAWWMAGLAYLALVVRPYLDQLTGFLANLRPVQLVMTAVGLAAAATLVMTLARRRRGDPPAWLPVGLVTGLLGAALYAYFFRVPEGLLAPWDAFALRTVTIHYVTPGVLAVALAGYAISVPRIFWKHTLTVLIATGYCLAFFYKIKIVPEHFWMARRFLPVIFPAIFLFAGAAAFYAPWRSGWQAQGAPGELVPPRTSGRRVLSDRVLPWLVHVRTAVGVLLLALAAWHFFQQTRPILTHIEYADVVPRLEKLAARFHDDDLVLVEARGASDVHVLALPLAYVYARNVLTLNWATPDKAVLADFLAWARLRYSNIFFVGGGGSDVLSERIDAEFVGSESFSVPEYERSEDRYPTVVRQKAFDFGIYRLVERQSQASRFDVDVGGPDDLYVTLFYGKERAGNTTFRWSGARSDIRVRIPSAEPTTLTLSAAKGGRPPRDGAARLSVYLNDWLIGGTAIDSTEFLPYTFAIPAGAAQRNSVATLRIETPTWSPRRASGLPDDRELGVMVDRVELR